MAPQREVTTEDRPAKPASTSQAAPNNIQENTQMSHNMLEQVSTGGPVEPPTGVTAALLPLVDLWADMAAAGVTDEEFLAILTREMVSMVISRRITAADFTSQEAFERFLEKHDIDAASIWSPSQVAEMQSLQAEAAERGVDWLQVVIDRVTTGVERHPSPLDSADSDTGGAL